LKSIKNFMTKAEKKEIIRVCGPNYEYTDIPPAIRKRDEAKARAEDEMTEEGIQREREKIREELETQEIEFQMREGNY